MNVILLKFSKRENSTKQPDITGITPVSCELKDDTSIMNPVLVFSTSFLPTPAINPVSLYNYVLINNFQRYYFIDDWKYILGRWEASLSVDVLASYKSAIGSSTEYVVRSASRFNGEIADEMYPATTDAGINCAQIDSGLFVKTMNSGFYIVGIINNQSNAAQGAITYYQMTAAQVATLKSYMMGNDFMLEQGLTVQTVTDVIPTDLLKTMYNPFQYIASCNWFPFALDAIPNSLKTSDSNIRFGWWTPTTSISGYRLDSPGYCINKTVTMPIYGHPLRLTRGVYLDRPPFTERFIALSPFGTFSVDSPELYGGDRIRINLDVSCVDGGGVLTVFGDRTTGNDSWFVKTVLYRGSAQVAIPIQLAQVGVDYQQTGIAMATSVGASIIGDIAKGNWGGLISNAGTAIGNAIAQPATSCYTSGHNGGMADYAANNYFVQVFKDIVADDNAQMGRPLCEAVQISTLSGYIKVVDADVNLSCLSRERELIKGYLESGFFYE